MDWPSRCCRAWNRSVNIAGDSETVCVEQPFLQLLEGVVRRLSGRVEFTAHRISQQVSPDSSIVHRWYAAGAEEVFHLLQPLFCVHFQANAGGGQKYAPRVNTCTGFRTDPHCIDPLGGVFRFLRIRTCSPATLGRLVFARAVSSSCCHLPRSYRHSTRTPLSPTH
ncbi:hypothetical protein T09_13723 [Trichinella sp. T9]|nr:hypothetical protein T09_13723 [Trichinella sp. T9]